MPTASRLHLALLLPLALLPGCAGAPNRSHPWNPLGWPAKALHTAGFEAADTGVPILRELGNLLQATGAFAESPALLAEAAVLLDSGRLAGAGEQLVTGTGSTITATWNLPFFVVPGRHVDLGKDAELVNDALAHLEQLPVEEWRFHPGDRREFVFPPGTRVRASGHDLIYAIPGHGDVLQTARSNNPWDWLQSAVGTDFPAQERSWGFVVRTVESWDSLGPRGRAETILHELYHQHMQMHTWLRGWTVIYWPAYMTTFPFTGWNGHWAEVQGGHAAGVVDRGLASWMPRAAG